MKTRYLVPFPFEVEFDDVRANLDAYVDAVFGCLESECLPDDYPRYEVVACIAGRGFGVRREDMKELLLATRGKVFTLRNMSRLVTHTRLAHFRSK